jgi:hypothetical protein
MPNNSDCCKMAWQTYEGHGMPCGATDIVEIRQRNGDTDRASAASFGWAHRLGYDGLPWGGDIIAWRMLGNAAPQLHQV